VNITKRRWRQVIGSVAIAGTAAVVLAGCTTSSTSTDSETSSTGGNVTVAEVNEATSFNYNTPQGNLDTNGFINYMTQPQFYTLSSDYKIVPNTDLGTYKKISSSPLTVKYTLNKNAKWSDGTAMTSDDLLLGWANVSGYYESSTADAAGKVTKGTQYFSTAGGFPFSTDYPSNITKRSITIKYKKPYVDWQLVDPIQFPAHVVAQEAGTTESDLMKAIKDTPAGDPSNPAPANPVLKKAASFINTGYDQSSLPSDKKLLVSGGPVQVTAWAPKQSMTFSKNPYYKGKHAVHFNKLVMRFIGDANAQVTALQNGEVDAIQPQASADTVKALKQAAGVKVQQGSQVAYDHLDLNFGSSVFKDEKVRKAFLMTIPRQQILDSIVTPIAPKSKVLNSQVFLPGQSGYSSAVADNGSKTYSKVDIAGAKKLLAGATPSVKILYNTGNPNRVDTFQAIQASAAKAGFKVIDGGDPNWSSLLAGGKYDASLFGWVNPGAGNAAIPQLFQANNAGNYNHYADPKASQLATDTQTTLNASKLQSMKTDIDKMTFDDAYGLPLFQLPGLFATNSTLKGVKYFGGQNGIFWNMWDWKKG
jgi:peptide/nickel transport system substrate-binding protein